MRANFTPPRHTTPTGAQPKSAAHQPRTLRFKTEDFEKTIDFLPRHKQAYARGIFPKDPTGRWMKTNEAEMNMFMSILDPHERETLGRIFQDSNISLKPGRMSDAAAAKLKDSGRFTPVPPPATHRPAKGADLQAPIGSHGAGPKVGAQDADLYPPPGTQEKRPPSKAQDLPTAPSGNTQGKPKPESANPKRTTLADLLAEERAAEKAGQGSHVPTQPQTKGQPNRVRFAEQAEVRKYPVGEDFQPGEFQSGSQHNMNFGPKDKPGRYRPPANTGTAQGSSTSGSTKPKREAQGQEAPYPLHDQSYPPPPPPKGILKKPEQRQESGPAASADSTSSLSSQSSISSTNSEHESPQPQPDKQNAPGNLSTKAKVGFGLAAAGAAGGMFLAGAMSSDDDSPKPQTDT
jgi:hypothetical protein